MASLYIFHLLIYPLALWPFGSFPINLLYSRRYMYIALFEQHYKVRQWGVRSRKHFQEHQSLHWPNKPLAFRHTPNKIHGM